MRERIDWYGEICRFADNANRGKASAAMSSKHRSTSNTPSHKIIPPLAGRYARRKTTPDEGAAHVFSLVHHQTVSHIEPQQPSITVLLVDDDPVNLRIGEKKLRKIGLNVRLAHDGLDAVSQIRMASGSFPRLVRSSTIPASPKSIADRYKSIAQAPIDIVIMDYHMPIKNGLEATQEIRQLERQGSLTHARTRARNHIPIIACTTETNFTIKMAFVNAGVDGFLPKPFSLEALAEMLKDVSQPRRQGAQQKMAHMCRTAQTVQTDMAADGEEIIAQPEFGNDKAIARTENGVEALSVQLKVETKEIIAQFQLEDNG